MSLAELHLMVLAPHSSQPHLIGLAVMEQLLCKGVIDECLQAHRMMIVVWMPGKSMACIQTAPTFVIDRLQSMLCQATLSQAPESFAFLLLSFCAFKDS